MTGEQSFKEIAPDIAQHLTAFIEKSRWFGGKGRTWRTAGWRRLGVLPTPADDQAALLVTIELVKVAYDNGDIEHYQLPLAHYSDPVERLPHALIGDWTDSDFGHRFVYDAVHDRDSMQRWLLTFDQASAADLAVGGLSFHRAPGHILDLDVHSTLFSGEQSNSSVAFGEDSLMKVFRKITPGRNPDVLVHRVLTEAGSEHVAHLYGWLEAQDPDGDVLTLAMLQQFLRTASDGWDLALASVRNLFAEEDLHAEEVGGDFAGEAIRLGLALAETHAALAANFPTHLWTTPELARLAGAMDSRLDAAIEVVPQLAEQQAALRTTYDALAALDAVHVQQIHGDLHLGQTLRTVKGWKIVDFEGEPAKPLSERLLPDSRWRDVAGMLRSFDYAPRVVAMTSYAHSAAATADQQAYRAREWSTRNQRAFLDAYAPAGLSEQEQILLNAYVTDKAVYEAVYEARNRPTWVSIPLDALAKLTELPD